MNPHDTQQIELPQAGISERECSKCYGEKRLGMGHPDIAAKGQMSKGVRTLIVTQRIEFFKDLLYLIL